MVTINSKKRLLLPSSCILKTTGLTIIVITILFFLVSFLNLHEQTRGLEQYYHMFMGERCDHHQTNRNTEFYTSPTISGIDALLHANSSYLSDPNPNMSWPRVVWLMSFPNSGTSYTMKLVSRASNRSVASNYGAECELDPLTGTNRPLIDSSMLEGTTSITSLGDGYTANGPSVVHFTDRQLPSKYILTKTHCGSRCSGCSPANYIETKESFMAMCSKGSIIKGKVNTTTGLRIPKESKKMDIIYNPYLAQRAIHLIRNPFDNIVSNFHLERNEKKKNGRQDWLQRYPNTILGFKKYCQDLDSKHIMEESNIRYLPSSIVQLFPNVPCHASFFMYIQWHNLAIQVQQQLHLPTLYIYYDDYAQEWNHTVDRILNFLQVNPWKEENIPPFVSGKNYTDYFSFKERNASLKLMKRLTDPMTFDLLKRYF